MSTVIPKQPKKQHGHITMRLDRDVLQGLENCAGILSRRATKSSISASPSFLEGQGISTLTRCCDRPRLGRYDRRSVETGFSAALLSRIPAMDRELLAAIGRSSFVAMSIEASPQWV
jgi:hypothetical protein